jgi:methyl-accepting chemotaxis protein
VVEDISKIVQGVVVSSQESAVGVNQTLDAAKGLSQLAEQLRELVKKIEV